MSKLFTTALLAFSLLSVTGVSIWQDVTTRQLRAELQQYRENQWCMVAQEKLSPDAKVTWLRQQGLAILAQKQKASNPDVYLHSAPDPKEN